MPKVIGLLRVRNEKMLVNEQINHLADLCNAVYVYDDGSTDGTLEIIQKHPRVTGYIANQKWKPSIWPVKDKLMLSEKNMELINFARRKENLTAQDWFIYTDVDEKFEAGFKQKLSKIIQQKKYDLIIFELYDFFITDKDAKIPYNGDIQSMRKYCGTEYRLLPFVFRNIPNLFLINGAVRDPLGYDEKRIWYSPYKIKHYGKAKTIDDYYAKREFYLRFRRQNRKAGFKFTKPPIHKVDEGKSDLGRLVTWDYLLAHPEIKGPEFYRYHLMPWGNRHKFTYLLAMNLIKLRGLIGKLILYRHWRKLLNR